jgi:ring-1,2-phenylacetyl-CoA epoxidase subunit PaaC
MNNLMKLFLHLGDNSMILSHRLSEYSSMGPFLEEDLATTNVALDHLGIAESFYEEAARLAGKGSTIDSIAYKRSESEYFNFLLVEQPNIDFAYITARQFFMDAFNYYYFGALSRSKSQKISEIAAKSLKEITYHLRRSSEWMIRLGDGTDEANNRLQNAINNLWKFNSELFIADEWEKILIADNIAPDLGGIKLNWDQKIAEIFYISKLTSPKETAIKSGGKSGIHTEYMGHILAEMQFLVNKYPDAVW